VGSGCKVEIFGLTIAHGFSQNGGGGIFSFGTLSVSNSTFLDNADLDVGGGGIYSHGTLTVSDSTFSGNSGDSGGGIVSEGTLSVSNSTFSRNSAAFAGGGIYSRST